MLASYYMLIRNKPVWAGLFSGILLWIRIDGIFWFCVLVFAAWYIRRQLPRNFIGVAILTYLPWLVFASIYFGSPIPHTIQAKWVEYYILGLPSVTDRILVILNWLTPFYLHSIPPYLILWIAAVFTLFACIGAIAYRHYKWLLILPVFCLEELIRLVVMGETYESRYYFPLFWALTILAGLGIHTVWAFLARQFKLKPIIGYSIIIGYCCICMWFSLQTAQLMQREQYYKNDLSLKELGIWLEKNTPTSSTVYLEPLGYVGFYANRYMIDQVGLINPQVVDLRKKGASMFDLIATFNPDYAVLHCDDALRSPEPFLTKYSKVFETNPLHFDPYHPLDYNPDSSYLAYSDIIIQRIACYQIWKR